MILVSEIFVSKVLLYRFIIFVFSWNIVLKLKYLKNLITGLITLTISYIII